MLKAKVRLISSVVTDILLINIAFLSAYYTCELLGLNLLESLKQSGQIPASVLWKGQFHLFLIIASIVTAIRLSILLSFQLYKPVWRYASVREFAFLVGAVTSGTLLLILVVYVVNLSDTGLLFLIDGLYNIALVGGAKFSWRLIGEYGRKQSAKPRIKVLIVGAGEAGVGVLREIRNHPERGYLAVGFIDDAPEKVGKSIRGLDVLGTTRELTYIVRKRQVDEVAIAMPSASGSRIREIIQRCEYEGCRLKIVPGIHAILAGHVSIDPIREVRGEDLFSRPTTPIDLAEVSNYLSGKRVMVTGGGGSIGSELCRQVARFNPELLIIYGRGENSLYHIDSELNECEPDLNRAIIIGDIRDSSKIDQIIRTCRPQIIFHAAAHKHVKFMETHPDEAVKNNIIGTKNLIDAAVKHHVGALILVSSDKAVNPTSVMGASKRVIEKLIQSKAKRNGTELIAVRFGNVIDSRGSVLPKFKRQIAKGGPVTVTHREVTRYFMTISEAVQLLIQAGAMGSGGEIFILDMGEPIKILDLARNLIKFSGFEVNRDIRIEFTGLEPGEKLYEELLTAHEGVTATKHQRIFVAQLETIEEGKLLTQIGELEEFADRLDTDGIIGKLQEIVPAYKPNRAFVTNQSKERKLDAQVINLPVSRRPNEQRLFGGSTKTERRR